MPGVGEDVEGPRRLDFDPESELAEPFDHEPPPLVVGPPHPFDVVAGVPEGSDPRPLDCGVGADEEVLLHLLDRPDELGRGDQVPQSKAGHGVELGEAVQDDGVLGELQNRSLPSSVDEAVVDLVGYDPDPQIGDRLHPSGGEEGPRGVRWRVDDDGLRPRVDPRGYGPGVELESLLRPDGDGHGDAAGKPYEVRVAGVAGVGDDRLVPGLQEEGEDEHHGGGGPRADDDPFGIDGDTVTLGVVLGYRLPQLLIAAAVGVVGVPLGEGGRDRLPYWGGEVEVRLAHLQVDYIDPLPLHSSCALQNVHHQKGGHLLGSFRDHACGLLKWVTVLISINFS